MPVTQGADGHDFYRKHNVTHVFVSIVYSQKQYILDNDFVYIACLYNALQAQILSSNDPCTTPDVM